MNDMDNFSEIVLLINEEIEKLLCTCAGIKVSELIFQIQEILLNFVSERKVFDAFVSCCNIDYDKGVFVVSVDIHELDSNDIVTIEYNIISDCSEASNLCMTTPVTIN